MKKLVSLLLACAMLLAVSFSLADGIGTPDQPVTVTYLCKDVLPDEIDTSSVMEAVEAGMAAQGNYVDIVVLEAPAGKYIDVVPLAFRTGEINPDIIYFQGNTDTPVVAENLLLDLTDYVANSTYVKKLMGGHSVARMANSPYLLGLAPASVAVPAIRKDVAAKLTTFEPLLADPTVDNYYNFFKEIKDSGTAVYAVGGDGSTGRLDSYFNHAFGVTSTIMKGEDGKYNYYYVTDAEKAKLEFYAKLYAEGLLDPDYITMTWDTLEQSFYEGETATICGRAGDVVQVYDVKVQSLFGEEGALVCMPAAKGVSQAYKSVDVTKEERGFGINATASKEVQDAAFAIFEFMASPEGRMIDLLGAEGVHYNVEDGTVVYTPAWDAYWARWFPTTDGLPEDIKLAKPVMTEAATESLALAAKYFADDINVTVPDAMQPLYAAVVSVYNEYSSDFIRGVRSFDDWDEFVAKYNEVGGAQLSEYFGTVLP